MHRVAIVRCKTYNVEDVKEALEKGINLYFFIIRKFFVFFIIEP